MEASYLIWAGNPEDCPTSPDNAEILAQARQLAYERGQAQLRRARHWLGVCTRARNEGRRAAKGAAGWYLQDTIGGRASGDTKARAQRILDGIRDGDSAILDGMPWLDLSGQWADGPSVGAILETLAQWGAVTLRLESEAQDELLDAYREGYDAEILRQVESSCVLEVSE